MISFLLSLACVIGGAILFNVGYRAARLRDAVGCMLGGGALVALGAWTI